MRVRSLVFRALAVALVLSGPVLGYAAASRKAAPKPSHHVYRLDYLVSVTEPGKPDATSTYTMNVEEDHGGDLRAGENLPLAPSKSSPRQDVGLSIHTQVTRLGNDLLLHNSTELSAPEDAANQGPRGIRKVSANGDAVASPGTPAVVMSVQEPVSHARYEVTVTATKLR